jgi:non-heme chloroperoxidase
MVVPAPADCCNRKMTTATIDGNDLYFEDEGQGPAVVLAHGWGSSARVWTAQQADLVPDDRVVSYDERGCRRSGRPAAGDAIARNAADLLALCHRLEIEAPVLVGNSIGATFATEAALAEPDYVAGIVAINGAGHWAKELAGAQLTLMRQMLRIDRAGTIPGWVPGLVCRRHRCLGLDRAPDSRFRPFHR